MLKLLPKIYYDLSIRNESPIPVVMPDVLTRIKMKITDANKKLMLFDYQIVDGETPELISLRFYNTMDFYWTVMYINERYDYISDFPMRYETLEKFCQKKYGAENVWNIHHYEDEDGNVVDEYSFDWKNKQGRIPTGILADIPVWKDYYQYSSTGYYRGEWQLGTTYYNGNIVKVSNGDPMFTTWRYVAISGSAATDNNKPKSYPNYTLQDYVDRGLNWQPYTGGTDWVQLKTKQNRAVSNFEYEDHLNEEKRMIKLVKPNYIGQFVNEYEKLLKNV